MDYLDIIVVIGDANSYFAHLSLKLTLIEKVKEKQNKDSYLFKIKKEIALRRRPDSNVSSDGV